MGHAFPLNQFNRASWIKVRQADMSRANRSHGPGKAPAVAMEHWQGPEINGRVRKPMLHHFAKRIDVSAAMGVHHALGYARGAAGVVNGNDAIFFRDDSRVQWIAFSN